MRLCTHPEHAQYGLGHLPGLPRSDAEQATVLESLPSAYIAPDAAPVLNQGSTPECEAYTAVTLRRITQPPVGQDGFDPDDLFRLAGGGADGTPTAAVERVLLTPGALCTSGPDDGVRKPVASCQNISGLAALKSAIVAQGGAGLARSWYESDFDLVDGTITRPRNGVAGGHIFRVKGWSDTHANPDTLPGALYCQNSWGTSWGVGGFFWLPFAYLDATLEAYTQIAIPLPTPPVPTPPTEVPVSLTFIPPVRLLDTRSSGGKLAPHVPRVIPVAGRAGIPANAVGIVGNVTVTNPSAAGYVAVGPDPVVSPSTSTLNFAAGQTIANAVTVGLHPDGSLAATFVAPAGQTTDLILDVTGYFTA